MVFRFNASFSHERVPLTEYLFVVLFSYFPDFLSLGMEINRLKDIFGVSGFANGTAIDLIEEEQEANEGHIEYEYEYNSAAEIVIEEDSGKAKRREEDNSKPNKNPIKDDCDIIEA